MHRFKIILTRAALVLMLTVFLIFYAGYAIPYTYLDISESNSIYFDKLLSPNKPLKINSGGGDTGYALSLADKIAEQNIHMVINAECQSACAENLLPAANSVLFKNEPLIGFHGNILAHRHAFENLRGKGFENKCDWFFEEKFKAQYKRTGHNPLFWQEQFKRLKPSIELGNTHPYCPDVLFNFTNEIWLPSSHQLSNLLKLEFKGKVCADNPVKCKKRINHRWPVGTRIVIGDETYISKGR